LILDEPTEGLDPNQILHIRNLIQKLAKDRTVIMSSHILSEVQATCQDVIIINQGRIAATTSLTDEFSKRPSYIFSFAQKQESALAWLQRNALVAQAKVFGAADVGAPTEAHGGILVDFQADFWSQGAYDKLADVNAQLLQAGFPVCGMHEYKTGLESLFFNVIKSQQAAVH